MGLGWGLWDRYWVCLVGGVYEFGVFMALRGNFIELEGMGRTRYQDVEIPWGHTDPISGFWAWLRHILSEHCFAHYILLFWVLSSWWFIFFLLFNITAKDSGFGRGGTGFGPGFKMMSTIATEGRGWPIWGCCLARDTRRGCYYNLARGGWHWKREVQEGAIPGGKERRGRLVCITLLLGLGGNVSDSGHHSMVSLSGSRGDRAKVSDGLLGTGEVVRVL